MANILIVGATSMIAQATAQRFASRGDKIVIAGRNLEKLNVIANDLNVRGASSVSTCEFNAQDDSSRENLVEQSFSILDAIDIVLIAYGTLPDQEACQNSPKKMLEEIDTNSTSIVHILTLLATRFETQRKGTLAVITSVAGDRGRQSNYLYGASKKMVSTFLQGLRNRLYPANVHVVDIKPGFVDTPMTEKFKKGFLWAKPDLIAQDIVQAIDKKKNVIYTPYYWRFIMLIIRSIPETIFKRLRL